MSNVVSLVDAKKAKQAHVSGPAKCLHCSHRWDAVAEPGTYTLECPACHEEKGIFAWPFCETGYIWTCACGCDTFQLTPFGGMCPKCGKLHRYEDLQ